MSESADIQARDGNTMDIPISGDHRVREWLLGAATLALAWFAAAAVWAVPVLALLIWGTSWLPLGPLLFLVAVMARNTLTAHGPLPGRAVRPAAEPELAALVQDVAERLGFHEPLLVRVVPEVQAALGRARVSGVRSHVLVLGLPLLRTLTEAELASVIAHELAHGLHTNSRRAQLLRYARARLADRLDGRIRPLAPLAGPLLRASQPVLWRAETAADADAARIAGAGATAGALRRTELLHSVFAGLGEAWLSGLAEEEAYPEDFYDAVDAALADPQVARRAARAAAEEEALDPYATADHPPVAVRVAALPPHTGAQVYGDTPVRLRTAEPVERWCVLRLALLDGEEEEDVHPVRLLDMVHSQLRTLGDDTGSTLLRQATGRDDPAAAVSAALDSLADGTWQRLARRLEPGLRWAPAAIGGQLARTVFTAAVSRTLAEALLASGWTPAGRWLITALTPPAAGDRVVDVHQLVGEAVDSGDPAAPRTLLVSAQAKENAV
ncbi:M48 family metalloprotease [Streptomyces sp. NPDC049687]|uniref:M48 family metalloprotease n=1 Tax=Streptomyces sp. NPDC049687 TaxID=3365596 RepID=UPI0037A1CC5D